MLQKSWFYDGKTAKKYDLDLAISSGRLIGARSSGPVLLSWDIQSIRVIEEPEDDREAIITAATDNEARLHIGRALFLQLAPMLSRKARPSYMISITARSMFFWFIIVIIFVFIIFYSFVRLTPLIARNIPAAWEKSLGEQQFNLLAGSSKSCHAARGLAALKKIGLALDNGSGEPLLSVIENNTVNAFALPGGRIVIYSGLIEKAGHPTELAGVIAHEMGHIVKGHPVQALVRNIGLGLIMKLLFGGSYGTEGVGAVGQTLFKLSYSRALEREADQAALQILVSSRVDPRGFRSFLKRIQMEEPTMDAKIWSYLSTHPKTSERISAIKDSGVRHDYRILLSEHEWQALSNICNDDIAIRPG